MACFPVDLLLGGKEAKVSKGQARAGSHFLGATDVVYIAFLSRRGLPEPITCAPQGDVPSAPGQPRVPKTETGDCRGKAQYI